MNCGIYRDRRDRLRASSEVFPSILANFLEMDVQEDPKWCEELLRGLDLARGGESFEAIGNLYALRADLTGASITTDGDDRRASLRLAVTDLRRALTAWRRAIGDEA